MKNIDYLFSNCDRVKRTLQGKFIYLFLDYDGTLAPIAKTPAKAFMPKETKKLLRRLSEMPNCKLAVISGRALKDIERRVGLKNNTAYVGNHGFEIKGPNIKFNSPVPVQYQKTIKEIRAKLGKRLSPINGVFVEDKGFSLSVHYRLAAKNNIRKVKDELHAALLMYEARGYVRVKPGKMVFEIRPPLAWDKGKAVLWLLARQKFAMRKNKREIIPIYIGDDISDEDAFNVLKDRGWPIRVGKLEKSDARYYLKDTAEVTRLLKLILQGSCNTKHGKARKK